MSRISQLIFSFVISLFFLLPLTAQAASTSALFHHAGDPVVGNPKGKVTVVEFFDYQCGHCVNMASTMAAIIKANPDVRIVYKDYPIRGPMSLVAARAAIAANMQGKYYEFNHALLSSNSLSESNILEIASSLGMNVEKLKKDMDSPSVYRVLKHNIALAQEMNVNGTPAFFIGKTNAKSSKGVDFVLGEMSQSELQEAIDAAKKS